MRNAFQTSGGSDPAGGGNRRARLQRDAALDRVGSITRGVAVGSIAAAVAIGLYLSRALPGHAARPVTIGTAGSTPVVPAGNSSTPPSSGVPATASAGAGASSTTLTPPTNPPTQTQRPAPVVSGST
jgi:hypothetical protein